MPEKCLICGKLTEKLHLQVNICYGCAAFYRRSVNKWNEYKCRFGNMKCNLMASKKGLCRLCRYNRCKELNLNIKKVECQHQTIHEIGYKPDNSDPWNIYDMFHQIHTFFNTNKYCSSSLLPSSTFFTNFTEVISKMINATLAKQEWIPFTSSNEALFKQALFVNNFSKNSAKLLSSFPSFQRLPLSEKLILHDRFWQMLIYLRDLYISFDQFGREEFKCAIDNFHFIDSTNVISFLEIDPENDGSKLFVVPYEKKHSKMYDEFKNIKITFYEFAYICVVALWSFHNLPQISQSTKTLGDNIIEDASTKLHEYYTKELRMVNYASRQSKLFKIAIMSEDIVQSKNEMLKAWSLFNFGKYAFPFPKFEINYYCYKN